MSRQHYKIDDPSIWPRTKDKWSLFTLYKVALYFIACIIGLNLVPNSIWDPTIREITFTIGSLGLWRYGWWFTHAVRAQIYARIKFPRLRARAEAILAAGWKAQHVHFMMTTYKEERKVTEMVMESILNQLRDMGAPGTIWLGSGDIYDEEIIGAYLTQHGGDLDLTLRIIRQNQPGKRLAIGLVLRAMSRLGIDQNDIIIFMDGDCILGPHCVKNCASLFLDDSELQAVTTDEEVVCIGPNWIRTWLLMRFAQRRVAMQSHALSGKVLTLTGRMSVFRAKHVTNLKLIRLLEADHLSHWLWGEFRFLSGDDKSTWYYMLLMDAKMLYVPDAMAYTVEFIEGSGFDRMVQNFRRWSGNMLRNGARALLLGPHKVGFFIWWCILDQRISMWTMLVSPVLAILACGLHSLDYIISYILWVAISRMALALVLFCYMRQVNLSIPWILYFNQLINASVKVYCLFRLSKQRWSNRGNQKSAEGEGWIEVFRNATAFYLTTFYVITLTLCVLSYSGLIPLPSVPQMMSIFSL